MSQLENAMVLPRLRPSQGCRQCLSSKLSCERESEACLRCLQRGIRCSYLDDLPNNNPVVISAPQSSQDTGSPAKDETGDTSFLSLLESLKGTNTSVQILTTDGWSPPVMDAATAARSCLVLIPDEPEKNNTIDFENIDLICPINAEDIQSRWLCKLVPMPGQTMSDYPPNIQSLIHQTLKSYAGAAIRGRGAPPFIHALQTADPDSNRPLATCLSLVRLLDNPVLGPDNRTMALIQEEMSKIRINYRSYENLQVLAAFQGYLICSMALFFYGGHGPKDFLAEAMAVLQEMARHVALQGLMTSQEPDSTGPRWEEWIVAESKSRTLFAMYLLDSLLSISDGIWTYLSTELKDLPAPGPKSLWHIRDRKDWNVAHKAYLAHWDGGAVLRVEELWPAPVDFSKNDLRMRSNRVDLWLEDLDEFGVMFYTVMASTHDSFSRLEG